MADSQRKSYNLFDKDNPDIVEYYTNSQTGVYTYSQNTRSVIIPCQSNKTYSATKSVQATAPRFSLSCYDNYPQENDIATAKVVNNDAMQLTLTTTANSQYLVLFFYYLNPPNASEIQQIMDTLMVNEGQPLPYEPYGWVHSLRKLTTATEAVENPLYSDGTAITAYTLKGNEEHTGTPTPSNPVTVQGVGNKTANLLNWSAWSGSIASINGSGTFTTDDSSISITSGTSTDAYTSPFGASNPNTYRMEVKPNTAYSISISGDNSYQLIAWENGSTAAGNGHYMNSSVRFSSFTTKSDTTFLTFRAANTGSLGSTATLRNVMVVEGEYTAQTMPEYEPYGYKIPISSGQTALNPMYFSQQLYKIGDTTDSVISSGTATYAVRKYEITGQENIEWKKSTAYLGGFYTSWRNSFNGIDNAQFYCSHAQYVASLDNYQQGTCYSDGSCNIRIMPDSSTVQDWIDYLTTQYANGTPVTIVYKLITPTTETFTAPSIPTTEGANSITVDTTVQPSEFTATWTGWHDAYVKEKSENLFDGTVRNAIINDSTGEETSNNNWRCSDFIKVADTKVTLSWVSDNQYYQAKLGYYEAADTETFLSTEVIQGNRYSGTFTIPENCNYIKISYSVVVSGNPVTREDIMLNEGTTAKTYAPYWK